MRTNRSFGALSRISHILVCACVLLACTHAVIGQPTQGTEFWPEFHNRYPSASAIPGAIDYPCGVSADGVQVIMGGHRVTDTAGSTAIYFVRYDKTTGEPIGDAPDLQWPLRNEGLNVQGIDFAANSPSNGNVSQAIVLGSMGSPGAIHPVLVSATAAPAGMLLDWAAPITDWFSVPGDRQPIAMHWQPDTDEIAVLCTRSQDIGGGILVYIVNDNTGGHLYRFTWVPESGTTFYPIDIGIDIYGVYVVGNWVSGGISSPRVFRFNRSGAVEDDRVVTPAPGYTSVVKAAGFGAATGGGAPFFYWASEVQQIGAHRSHVQVGSYYILNPWDPVPQWAWDLRTGKWRHEPSSSGTHEPKDICATLDPPGQEDDLSGFRLYVTGRQQPTSTSPGDLFTISMQYGSPEWEIEWEEALVGLPLEDYGATITFIGQRVIVTGSGEVSPGSYDHLMLVYASPLAHTPRLKAWHMGPEKNPNLPGTPYFNGPNDRGTCLYPTIVGNNMAFVLGGRSYHPTTHDDAFCELFVISPN